ncbi:MAG: hypothetical protein K0S83_1140, partial [Thermomicrobiales bacterium]|nr:hypothetical protein [Thermomicrobiales bacterium]
HNGIDVAKEAIEGVTDVFHVPLSLNALHPWSGIQLQIRKSSSLLEEAEVN